MLRSCAAALPERVRDNHYFEARLETTDEWIVKRTGIRTRRVLSGQETLSSLAARCAIDACREAGNCRVNLVIVASSTPDDAFGDAGGVARALHSEALATDDCTSFDVRSACCGFVDAIALALRFKGLACIVGCDALASRLSDEDDRSTSILFGDAAAAAVIECRSATTLLRGYPGTANSLSAPVSSSEKRALSYDPVSMNGADVFAFATREVPAAIRDAVKDAGWKSADLVVLHQANARIVKLIAANLGLDESRCPSACVRKYGNCGAASIPMALADLDLRAGQRLVLAAFGAGPRVSIATVRVDETMEPYDSPKSAAVFLDASLEKNATMNSVLRALSETFVGIHIDTTTRIADLSPDSLSSVEFASRLKSISGADVAPTRLLEAETVHDLIAFSPRINSLVGPVFRVTALQHAMLFHHVRSKRGFLESFVWDVVSKQVGEARLTEAWRRTVLRHEALRSSFDFKDGSWPTQRIHDQADDELTAIQSTTSVDEEGEEEVRKVAAQQRAAVVKAVEESRPHLARLAIVNGQRLVATFHHLIIDGLSLAVILRDLIDGLDDEIKYVAPRWRDFASILPSQPLVEDARRYYEETTKLSETTTFAPKFDPDRRRLRASRRTGKIGELLERETRGFALSAVAHAAFLAAMNALGCQFECYSATFATRHHRAGFAKLVGPAMNTLPVKNHYSESFDAAVTNLQKSLAEALRIAEVPLDEMKRGLPPPPQIVFDFQNARGGGSTWIECGPLAGGRVLDDSAGVALSVRCVRDNDRFVLVAVSESPDVDSQLLVRICRALDVCLETIARGGRALLRFAIQLADRENHCLVDAVEDEYLSHEDTSLNNMEADFDLEQSLTQAVASELGIDMQKIEPSANLFALGVDSLKAMRILARCSRSDLTLKRFFETPTIRALAKRETTTLDVLAATTSVASPFQLQQDEGGDDEFPLFGVGAAHFVGLHEVTSSAPISPQICWEWEMDDLDLESFEAAWDDLVSRHEALRCVVTREGSLKSLGRVGRVKAVRKFTSVSQQREFFETGDAIESVYEWPLFAIGVILRTQNASTVHVAMSLFLMDAVADNIFRAELSELYAARKERRRHALIAPAKLSFGRYARSLLASVASSAAYAAGRNFWMKRLSDPNFPRAGPSLFTHANVSARRTKFENYGIDIDAATWSRFLSNCSENGTTAPVTLLTAYALALARHSDSKRFLLNVLLCVRYPVHEDVLRIMGNCSTTILVEIDLMRVKSLSEATKRVASSLAASLEHNTFSGIEVMAMLNRQTKSTFEAVAPFIFTTPIGIEAGLPDENVRERKWAFRETRFSERVPHTACVNAIKDNPATKGARASLDFLTGLFPDCLVNSLVDSYSSVIAYAARADADWASCDISSVFPSSLVPSTSSMIEHPSLPHKLGLPYSTLLHDALFAARGDSTYIISHEEKALTTMTYADVAKKVRSVAHRLSAVAVPSATDEILCAVVMQKSWQQVIAVHAILYIGGAYLPIDARLWPTERVNQVLEESGASVALVDVNGSKLVKDSFLVVLMSEALTLSSERLTSEGNTPQRRPPTSVAYVIYTSGSTGKPKGVMCHHLGAINTIADLIERWSVESNDRILGLAALSFDLSVFDIFGSAIAGCGLVLPKAQDLAPPDPDAWLELVRTTRVTIWNSVPALLELAVVSTELRRTSRLSTSSLRLAMVSGDVVPPRLPGRAVDTLGPQLKVVLMGGATEAAIWSNEYLVDSTADAMPPVGWSSWPYGRAMYGQTLEVLDDSTLAPLPPFTVGPIYIGGAGVALGYRGDPSGTRRQFLKRDGKIALFRTGDLGRVRPHDDGWIVEILGREDSQVKLRGNRIELGEIDLALASLPGVSAAACVVRKESLLAFIVVSDISMDERKVLTLLSGKLPQYMIPVRVVKVETLPLSSNGKVQREKLKMPPCRESLVQEKRCRRARNDREREIATLFSQFLGTAASAVCCDTTDFFQVGGSSLSALRLVSELNRNFRCRLGPRDLLENPNVASLATVIEKTKPTTTVASFERLPLGGNKKAHIQFILFNPAGASGLCYVPLSNAMSEWSSTVALDDGVVCGRLDRLPFETLRSATLQARDVVEPLIHLAGAKKIILGGWSYGGVLALETAKILGDKVDGLLLVDAPVLGSVTDTEKERDAHFVDATALLAEYHRNEEARRGDKLGCALLHLRPTQRPLSSGVNDDLRFVTTGSASVEDMPTADHWSILSEKFAPAAAVRINAWVLAAGLLP